MQNNDFDKGIRDLLNCNEPEYNPADWDRMEDLLHQAAATQQNTKPNTESAATSNAGSAAKGMLAGGKVWVAAAMVALTGVNVAVLVTSQNAPETAVSPISEENTEIANQNIIGESNAVINPSEQVIAPENTAVGLERKARFSAGLQEQNAAMQQPASLLNRSNEVSKSVAGNAAAASSSADAKSNSGNSGPIVATGIFGGGASGNAGFSGNNGGFFHGLPAKAGLEAVSPCAGNQAPHLPYLVSGTDTVTTFQFALKTCEPFCLNLPATDAEGDKIKFSASLAQLPGAVFETNPENGAQASFCWTPKAAQARLEPYVLKVNLQNENCPGVTSYSILLTVAPSAALRISGDTLLMAGQQTRLRASGASQEVTYKWLSADGLTGALTGPEVLATPSKNTTYTLQMTTAGGCQVQARHTIRIATENQPESVFVPNIFTPNGDGVNDFFEVKGIEPGEMDLTVYNRSGKVVFSSPSYANTWNGGNLPEGVYTYVLRNTRNAKLFRGMVEINR